MWEMRKGKAIPKFPHGIFFLLLGLEHKITFVALLNVD